jgi:Mg/Co/Ni transporter MgtE
MTNNKAREINSPIIEELINETTPQELAKIDTEMTNNKQQTAVKLYTEEQVLQIIGNLNREYFVTSEELLEEMKYTPIELPTDEEIEKESFDLYANHNTYSLNVRQYKAFKRGAKWMRDKIQGNDKQ